MSLFECFKESTDEREREMSGSAVSGDKGGDDCGVVDDMKWSFLLLILDEKLVKKYFAFAFLIKIPRRI